MLVGRWLFHPVDGGEDWSLEDDHLAKMIELTGETFSEAMRNRACRGPEFFASKGKYTDSNALPQLIVLHKGIS